MSIEEKIDKAQQPLLDHILPSTRLHRCRMQPDFKYSCGWNRFLLEKPGLWPKSKKKWITKFWTLLNGIIVLLVLGIPRFAALPFIKNGIDAFIQCLSTQLGAIMAAAKLIVFYLNNEVLAELLIVMEIDLSKEFTKDESEVLMKMANIGRRISMISSSLTYIVIVTGFIAQKVYHFDSLYIDNPDARLTTNLLWMVYLPFDTQSIINYVILFALQLWASIIATIIFFGFDSFIVMIILHLCGQLGIVRLSLQQLTGDHMKNDSANFRRRLRTIVQKHEQLIRSIENLEDSLTLVLLLQLLSCTLTFCLEGYAILRLVDKGELNFLQILFSVSITFNAVLHFFFFCLAGELLISQSSAVGQAVYHIEWHDLPHVEVHSLLIIGFKSFRQLTLTTGKFSPLSFHLFLQMIKTTMSYLSVLLAVQKVST